MSLPAEPPAPTPTPIVSRPYLEAKDALGDVEAWLRARRSEGLSDAEIAFQLRDRHSVRMTPAGIRGWRLRLDIP